MNGAEVELPVQRLMSMMSREELMSVLTVMSCGRVRSGVAEEEAEGLMVTWVDGVEEVWLRGVFGGSVARRRRMSWNSS